MLYDTDLQSGECATSFTRIQPIDNSVIFFPSGFYHQITPVHYDTNDFGLVRIRGCLRIRVLIAEHQRDPFRPRGTVDTGLELESPRQRDRVSHSVAHHYRLSASSITCQSTEIPTAELNSYVLQYLGADALNELESNAQQTGANPDLAKALALAHEHPDQASAIVKVLN